MFVKTHLKISLKFRQFLVEFHVAPIKQVLVTSVKLPFSSKAFVVKTYVKILGIVFKDFH